MADAYENKTEDEKTDNIFQDVPIVEEGNQNEKAVNKALEKALIRKVDWCIIPLIMLIYLFSFLDRGKSDPLFLKRSQMVERD
jgi:hypothetical protein